MTAGAVGYAAPYIADADADDLPDPRGCVLLIEAFWAQVHHDLSSTLNKECSATVRWVDTSGGFDAWCEMSGAKPDEVRAVLEERYPRAFACYRR